MSTKSQGAQSLSVMLLNLPLFSPAQLSSKTTILLFLTLLLFQE